MNKTNSKSKKTASKTKKGRKWNEKKHKEMALFFRHFFFSAIPLPSCYPQSDSFISLKHEQAEKYCLKYLQGIQNQHAKQIFNLKSCKYFILKKN